MSRCLWKCNQFLLLTLQKVQVFSKRLQILYETGMPVESILAFLTKHSISINYCAENRLSSKFRGKILTSQKSLSHWLCLQDSQFSYNGKTFCTFSCIFSAFHISCIFCGFNLVFQGKQGHYDLGAGAALWGVLPSLSGKLALEGEFWVSNTLETIMVYFLTLAPAIGELLTSHRHYVWRRHCRRA